jgi:5-methylcytosine-specific restriction endonuclease McrA
MAVSVKLRRLVWQRAHSRCEYCRIPSHCDILPFTVDHVIALKHHGATEADNLALACAVCNSYKLDNLSGVDPLTNSIVTLFHPRKDCWEDHFVWSSAILVGVTPKG